MELNWLEKIFVNSPIRLIMQSLEMRWFVSKLPLNALGNVLEIGCGRGAGAGLILEKFNPSRLCLSDLDIEMVRKARLYLGDDRSASVHFCQSDATHLPFGNQRFDAVFGFGFLHVLAKPSALWEVLRAFSLVQSLHPPDESHHYGLSPPQVYETLHRQPTPLPSWG